MISISEWVGVCIAIATLTPKVNGPLIMTKHLEYILTVIFAKYKIAPSQVMATLKG